MADERAYRILLQYVAEDDAFLAEAPELELRVEADSRAEALEKLEGEIDARVEKAAVEGSRLPAPADLSGAPDTLSLALAAPLWRDLLAHARAQKLEPSELAIQLLSRALGQLDGRPARRPSAAAEPEAPVSEDKASGEAESKKEGARRRGRGRGRNGGRREGYRPDMEDQANFLAYVRDQERGGRGRR